ncbi:hypothetical protein HDU79_009687 [Rhizoclosmatium sp. JEL0117]|nr:hypothetical protein HDU79_009687 [Rhizoclosmatium sp. JEL0117]
MSISTKQLLTCIIAAGVIAEVAFTGSIKHISQTISDVRAQKRVIWAPTLLINGYNFFCIIDMIVTELTFTLNENDCDFGQRWANVIAHCSYLTFDSFILYKTYAISGFNSKVLLGIITVLLHRLVWTLLDLINSGGLWDVVGNQCLYNQYPLSGIGYNSSDVVCDVFSLTISFLYTYKNISDSQSWLERILLFESVIRSAIICSVNFYGIYVYTFVTDGFTIQFFYMIQNYAYSKVINSELFWSQLRKSSNSRASTVKNVVKDSIARASAAIASSTETRRRTMERLRQSSFREDKFVSDESKPRTINRIADENHRKQSTHSQSRSFGPQ